MTAPVEIMKCMEVWGGNRSVNDSVVVAGLDAWIFSRPFGDSAGGGDVYYASSCATGRIARVLLADVSGHGAAVNDAAVRLRDLMRGSVNRMDQAGFVRSLNREFSAFARDGNFATAVVATFFAPTGRLTLCNAGHPPPLLYRAASRQWSALDERPPETSEEPANLPLGILDLADYQTFDVPLETGDLLVCYTDALVESRSEDGELLGQDGLLRIIRGISSDNPRQFVADLLAAIASRYDTNLTGDDVTLMVFRPNGQGRGRPSLRTQMRAAVRMTAAIARSMRRGGPSVPWPDVRLPKLGGMFRRRTSSRPISGS